MGRGKSVVPSLIQDKRKRIQTFEKRRKGLEKKAHELSTLCDVNISMIMFSPDDEVAGSNDPIIWPEDPNVANNMINLYQNKHKTDQNCSRNADIASVYQDRARIVGKEVEKLKKQKSEDKYPVWDELYDSFSNDQLLVIGNELDNILAVLQSRIDSMKTHHQMSQDFSSYSQLHGFNSFNCLGSEAPIGLSNSQSMNTVYGNFNCFGNDEGALVGQNSQTMNIMNESFNCFGNAEALLHNTQTMNMIGESSSCSNIYNYNNNILPIPANFDHMIANTNGWNGHLPPLPGFVDNLGQNNNKFVMDQLQDPYLCYAPSQSQKSVFMPFPLSSYDLYSQMVHGQIGDAKINQFGGSNFLYR